MFLVREYKLQNAAQLLLKNDECTGINYQQLRSILQLHGFVFVVMGITFVLGCTVNIYSLRDNFRAGAYWVLLG